MDLADNDLTTAQWAALRTAWGGCAYCGTCSGTMQRDCVLPLSRGGRYTLENVVPACRACNTSKCNSEVTGWLRRKRLDERQFLSRYVEIRAALMRSSGPAPSDPAQDGPVAAVPPSTDGASPLPAQAHS